LLSRALVAYGLVGLVVGSFGLGAMLWVNARISAIRTEADANLATAATTMQLAATVLRSASTTTQSFSATTDHSSAAVASAATTITEVRADLRALEEQLRSVSFLGATPLASSADSVSRIAAGMEGLDTQVPAIAADLKANRDALAATAGVIANLADSATGLAVRVRPAGGDEQVNEVQRLVAITLLTFATWSLVQALLALALGVALSAPPSPPSKRRSIDVVEGTI
jgi:hypothetical protein